VTEVLVGGERSPRPSDTFTFQEFAKEDSLDATRINSVVAEDKSSAPEPIAPPANAETPLRSAGENSSSRKRKRRATEENEAEKLKVKSQEILIDAVYKMADDKENESPNRTFCTIFALFLTKCLLPSDSGPPRDFCNCS